MIAVAVPVATANTTSAVAAAVVSHASEDRTDQFSYDTAGRLISCTDALGNSESYSYNGLGLKTSFTNKLGAVWIYEYDAAGQARGRNNPMSLLNPDQSTPGGFVGGLFKGGADFVVQSGRIAFDAAKWLGRAAAGQPHWEVDYSSGIGQLLANDQLTIGDKAKALAIGSLQMVGNALQGDPQAIGGLLAGWGTGRLLSSPGSSVAAVVDELTITAGRFADKVMASVSRETAVELSYSTLRSTGNAAVELQVAAEANALALADRLGQFTKGDILEIQAYRQAVRNGDTVLIDGRRLEMLQNATEGVSRQGGFDLPVLRTVDGRSQLVIGEVKNYAAEASGFSAVTRNFDYNLSRLNAQVEAGTFNLSERATATLLNDIQTRNLTVEIYGNRATTMNNLPQLTNQIRANGTNINTTFRRVPW